MSKKVDFKSHPQAQMARGRSANVPGVSKEVEQFMGHVVMRFNEAINAMGRVVNNLAIRVETVVHALEKRGDLTSEEILTAQKEFLEFRDKLQELMSVPGFARYEAFQEWNSKADHRRIRATELELHAFAMEDRSLTLEQRLQIAQECGFGEAYIDALQARWARPEEGQSPASEEALAEEDEDFEEPENGAGGIHLVKG